MAMTEGYYHDNPPPAERRVTALYAWVATYADGREGILSADMPFEAGNVVTRRHMPLLSSQREVAESLGVMALRVQRAAMHQADRIVQISLRTFTATDYGDNIPVTWGEPAG